MANAAGTAQKMRRRKENHKFSRMMAVILGLIVTVEVMIAGGMIFNIDFHSADIVAVIMGFIVLYSGVVAGAGYISISYFINYCKQSSPS